MLNSRPAPPSLLEGGLGDERLDQALGVPHAALLQLGLGQWLAGPEVAQQAWGRARARVCVC